METLRALAAGNTGVPESLEAAVLARVRRAGQPVETLLRAGAVLGTSFDPVTVAGLLGESSQAMIAACADAHAARLLVVAERDYEFANAARLYWPGADVSQARYDVSQAARHQPDPGGSALPGEGSIPCAMALVTAAVRPDTPSLPNERSR